MKLVTNYKTLLLLFLFLCSSSCIDLTQEKRDEATPYLKIARIPYCQSISTDKDDKCPICSILDDLEQKVKAVSSKTVSEHSITMVITESDKETVISFGGIKTEEIASMVSMYSSKRKKIAALGNIAIEPMLWQLYKGFRNELHNAIKESKNKIVFTGHSIGGNIAAIAALDIKVNGLISDEQKTYLYTFGALKMGPRRMWRQLHRLFKGRVLRVRKKKDLITIMPRCVLEDNTFKCYQKRKDLIKDYPQYKNHFVKVKGDNNRIKVKKGTSYSMKKKKVMVRYKKDLNQKKKLMKKLKESPDDSELKENLKKIKRRIRKEKKQIKRYKKKINKKNNKVIKTLNTQKKKQNKIVKKVKKQAKKITRKIKKQIKRLKKLMKKKMTKKVKKQIQRAKRQIKKLRKQKRKKNTLLQRVRRRIKKLGKRIRKARARRKQRRNRRRQRRKNRRMRRKNKRRQRRSNRKNNKRMRKQRRKANRRRKRMLRRQRRKQRRQEKKRRKQAKKARKQIRKINKKKNKYQKQLRKLQRKGKGNSRKAKRLMKKIKKLEKKKAKVQRKQKKSCRGRCRKNKCRRGRCRKNKCRRGRCNRKKCRRRFLFFIQRASYKMKSMTSRNKNCINKGTYIQCDFNAKTHSHFWKLNIENCK